MAGEDRSSKVDVDLIAAVKKLQTSGKSDDVRDDELAVIEHEIFVRKEYTALQRQDAETEKVRQENEDKRENRKLRQRYARWVFWYMCGYSLAMFGLVVASGIECSGFELEPTVLVTLVGGTAISAIGLVVAVVKGLFGSLENRG